MIQKQPVARNPWAHQVTVSRTRDGRWILDRVASTSIYPAKCFANWDEAEWTANHLANEELKQRQNEAAAAA